MKITLVITSFRRPDFVVAAVDSALKAGYPTNNIIVTDSSPDSATEQALAGIAKRGIRVLSLPQDLGNTECWLRGVSLATTPYVQLLHDDDALSPDLAPLLREFENKLDSGAGFVMWHGRTSHTGVVRALQGDSRDLPTEDVMPYLMTNGNFAISPGASIFRRVDVMRALRLARLHLPHSCYVKPGMLVGDDLWIYLYACQQHVWCHYAALPLIEYGWHPGSTTVRLSKRIVPRYDTAREVWRQTKLIRPAAYWHCWDNTVPDDHRYQEAQRGWVDIYSANYGILPCWVEQEHVKRSGTAIKDVPVLYVRDVIDHGLTLALPEDVLILTNRDVIPVPSFMDRLRGHFESGKVVMASIRHTVTALTPTVPLNDLHHVPTDGGTDIYAMTVDWWKEHRGAYQDYLLGRPWWDPALSLLMAKSVPYNPFTCHMYYHRAHSPLWLGGKNAENVPTGTDYNIQLAVSLARRLGYASKEEMYRWVSSQWPLVAYLPN